MNEETTPEQNQSPAAAPPYCPSCHEQVSSDDTFCQHCAYPLKGTEEERHAFTTQRLIKEDKLEEMEKKIKGASNTMYILSGLFCIFGLIFYASLSDNQYPGAVLLINLIVAAVYVGLGYWSRVQPLPAIISGLVLFAAVTVLNAIGDPASLAKGIIVKIFVFVFLIKGLKSAYEAQQIKKELNIV